MTSTRTMLAEIDALIAHARRTARALHELPVDRITARTELSYILAAMPELRAIYEELGTTPSPPVPPAA
jgi:PIN domain nuclease of toxin-antitoxin system